MKHLLILFALATSSAFAQVGYVNFVRQSQQSTSVVWDMPVAAKGTAPSALMIEQNGALFQLWTVEQSGGKDFLLDQKLVGAYLPVADITITTLDPNGNVPRTRVDKAFTVRVNVSGLLSGSGLPLAATQVLLQQYVAAYPAGSFTLNPTTVVSGTPLSARNLTNNGMDTRVYPPSVQPRAPITDTTKALGEEHFVVHALSDGTFSQTQLDSAFVQVWPVASGEIRGVIPNKIYGMDLPTPEIVLEDLYPRSDTYLLLFEGNGTSGPSVVVKTYPMDRAETFSTSITVPELASKVTKEGAYTLALVSDTVYGRELLGPTISFRMKGSIRVNAMQMTFSDGATP